MDKLTDKKPCNNCLNAEIFDKVGNQLYQNIIQPCPCFKWQIWVGKCLKKLKEYEDKEN